MPREIVHWAVLNEALRIARCDPGDALPLFALGAVAPDAPYFQKFGTSTDFARFGASLHGANGEDTHALPRALLLRSTEEQKPVREALRAFAIGYLSHCATDQVFHPFIYYFTGNYDASEAGARAAARQRHRLLEVYLDEHWRRYSPPQEILIRKLIAKAGPGLIAIVPRLSNAAHEIFHHTPAQGEFWLSSIRWLAASQMLFMSTSWGALMRCVNTLTGNSIGGHDALFRYRRTDTRIAHETPFVFRNPVTGEERSGSLRSLFEQSVERTSALITAVMREDSALAIAPGTSLSFDLHGVKSAEAKHFSNDGLDLPGLRIGESS